MVFGGSPIMKIKHMAGGAFLLNTFLFGSYYAISKEVLGRVDPIVFSFCEMMTLVPPALIILACSWRHMTRQAVKNGFALGSCLCLGLFMLSVALRYNSATGTAFFPALNGLLAVLFTWLFLRQPIAKTTWFAGIVSVTGAFLLMANANMGGIRGSLIAFIGGLFCTLYIFLADHFLTNRSQKDQAAYWPLFAVELLTMALWGNLIALLFGDWNMVHFALPKDTLVILYIGLGTVFLPTLITVLLQKYISPVTVSFISILEPILGALVAFLYLHEVLPLDGYLGGGLIVTGVLIHTWGSVERKARANAVRTGQTTVKQRVGLMEKRFHTSAIAMLLYPLLCCGIGAYIVSRLGGFPPPAWRMLFQFLPQFPSMIQQGQAMDVCILVAQSLSWLIAWTSLLLMGGIATYRAVEKLFIATQYPRREVKSVNNTYPTDWQYQKYASNVQNVQIATAPTLILPRIGASPIPVQEAEEPTIEVSRVSHEQALLNSVGAEMDVRSLRQMGYTPYSVSTRPAKRKLDAVQLQQRRLQHRIRLAQVEPLRATEPLLGELPADSEQPAIYNDAHGNAYLYWDEFSHDQDIPEPYTAFHLRDIEKVQEGG
jgi:drug/metabolite transporter (DMT)-like permease